MRKVTTLSLALLLAIGLFVTGCKKKAVAPEQNEKAEVKAPAEKTVESPAEKEEKASAAAVEADKGSSEKADKPSANK